MFGVRQLMRSLALDIDSIVRGKLRQIAAGYGNSRQSVAISGCIRRTFGVRRFPAEPGDIRRRRRYKPTAGRQLNREGF